MKRKTKILIGTLVPLSALTATIVGAVVGVKIKNDKLINSVKDEMVNVFTKGFCPIYHETFHTRKIADYIIKYVKDLGLDIKEDTDYPSPSEKTENTSGNLIYDIPASKGCSDWIGVTLQAHMDMVCSHDKAQEPHGHDWTNGVDIVQEGNILHSRNNLTTIGADDGVGLSMILALTKYRNKFTHGPIRVIVTADEEEGDSGASVINAEKIKYKRLINIDGSNPGDITKSCAGTVNNKFNIPVTWNSVTSTNEQFTISISNIKSSHSADINKNSLSGIKLAFEILKDLSSSSQVEIIDLDASGANNYINNAFTLSFTTNKENAEQWLKDKMDEIKQKHPLETEMVTKVTKLDAASKFTKAISNSDSQTIINLISSEDIPFKVIEWLDEQETIPATSNNIAPLEIKNESTFTFETLTRSCYDDTQTEVAESICAKVKEVYPSSTSSTVATPPWEFKEVVPFVDLIQEAFRKNKVTPKICVSHGWLECSFFAQADKDLQIASIGAKVSNEHDPKESTDISSYPSVIKTVIYTLQHLK